MIEAERRQRHEGELEKDVRPVVSPAGCCALSRQRRMMTLRPAVSRVIGVMLHYGWASSTAPDRLDVDRKTFSSGRVLARYGLERSARGGVSAVSTCDDRAKWHAPGSASAQSLDSSTHGCHPRRGPVGSPQT